MQFASREWYDRVDALRAAAPDAATYAFVEMLGLATAILDIHQSFVFATRTNDHTALRPRVEELDAQTRMRLQTARELAEKLVLHSAAPASDRPA